MGELTRNERILAGAVDLLHEELAQVKAERDALRAFKESIPWVSLGMTLITGGAEFERMGRPDLLEHAEKCAAWFAASAPQETSE